MKKEDLTQNDEHTIKPNCNITAEGFPFIYLAFRFS